MLLRRGQTWQKHVTQQKQEEPHCSERFQLPISLATAAEKLAKTLVEHNLENYRQGKTASVPNGKYSSIHIFIYSMYI